MKYWKSLNQERKCYEHTRDRSVSCWLDLLVFSASLSLLQRIMWGLTAMDLYNMMKYAYRTATYLIGVLQPPDLRQQQFRYQSVLVLFWFFSITNDETLQQVINWYGSRNNV